MSLEDKFQYIHEKISIDTVIKDYVELKQRGKNYIGLCPFHEERVPSFTVSPVKGLFKCFGCGKGGNVLIFIMSIENLSQTEAIKYLIKKYLKESEISLKSYYANNPFLSYIEPALQNFENQLEEINELLEFDKLLIDLCLSELYAIKERLTNIPNFPITNPRLLPLSSIKQLETIKENESLSKNYQTIYNQSLVLLVSYFTNSLKEIFKKIVLYQIDQNNKVFKNVKSELKITLEEIEELQYDIKSNLGQLIIEKKNISFQDMKSILRAFKDYFQIDLENNDLAVHNIIMAQAARHSIVHSLSLADDKFMNQISFAKNRSLKRGIKIGDEIQFQKNEVKEVMDNMKLFLNNIFIKIS